MHLPDGFLSNRLALSLDAVSAATVFYSAVRARVEASGRIIPTMGVLAAFVFAAQLLNFPVLGGTSGHLVGGALLAIVVGPACALLTMATVIIAQSLFLQDGGIIALGANIFNIGAVTVFSGYFAFRLLGGERSSGRHLAVAAFLAGWVSAVVSAVSCAVQLGLSGTVGLRAGMVAMAGYYSVIGLAEGGLTAGIVTFLSRVRPELVSAKDRYRFGIADWIGALVLIVVPFSILALAGTSSLPDPLQALLEPMLGVRGAAPADVASGSRYMDYLWHVLFFLVLIALAFLVAKLAGRRSKRA